MTVGRREAQGTVNSFQKLACFEAVKRQRLATVDDVLDFSKAEAGQLPIDDSPLALPDVLQMAVNMVRAGTEGGFLEDALDRVDGRL